MVLITLFFSAASSVDFIENKKYPLNMNERFLIDRDHNSENVPDEPTVFQSASNSLKDLKDLTKTRIEMRGSPMDSQWPVASHDVQHTGRSPYSTASTPFVEKWRFPGNDWIYGSPVIDNEGTVYFGADDLFAVYSNGSLKWKVDNHMDVHSAPAIDENGIIYAGTVYDYPNRLYAFYSNGTVKWSYVTGNHIFSSPVIGEDGTIYFGDNNGNLNALYPNGTLKWITPNIYSVYSSPAIGDDGTIYCTSWYGKVYALYPDNGTVKWQFSTGGQMKANPSIADDGTIYVSSWDDYLYALYPGNGTMKWRVNTNYGSSNNPSIGPDGTIYVAHVDLYAVNPDGTVKWIFPLGDERHCSFAAPAISADGIIYIGANIGDGVGGELIVINPDGTERWRSGSICNEGIVSSPAIAEDGTVYIGSLNDEEIDSGWLKSRGFLHAFGPGDIKKIEIEEPKQGKLYFFGSEILSTPKGRTFIVGPIDIKVNTYTSNELEKNVSIYIDFTLQYSSSEPSFVWTLDKRLGHHSHSFHVLKINATYKGGCEWYEQWWFWYFHL